MPPGWERVGPVAQAAIFTVWAEQISLGHLTKSGLHAIRMRLLFAGEFERGPALEQMLIMVGDAIAADLHVAPSLLPGSPLAVPDDARELDEDLRDW